MLILHVWLFYIRYILQACKVALDEGWAINIGGGFSHYPTNTGGGLAVYDDVLVCLAVSQLAAWSIIYGGHL